VVVDGSGLARLWAGVGTYTIEILRALAAERPGNRFTVFTSAEPGIEQPAIAFRRPPSIRLIGRHLIWPARLRRMDANLYFGPAGVMPLGDVGLPAVVTAHDMAIYKRPEWFPSGQSLAVRTIVPRSMRRAQSIIAVSVSTARDVAEIFDIEPARLEVVHEGVARRYRPLPPDSLEVARSRLRLPRRFILFVSTIEPRKNLITLLEAWARMRERLPLVIAGSWGWNYDGIRQRLEHLGPDLMLLGALPPADMPALYNLATCLAHPAWYEGFGLTPLESMACGTPVVSSNASSLPEVVGDAGILVDPADVQGWTDELDRLCNDSELRATLRRRGILRAAEFGWDRAAYRTWRVMERVVRAAGFTRAGRE
jgi:glycosyltransferase involved in cell wall biosynthesis